MPNPAQRRTVEAIRSLLDRRERRLPIPRPALVAGRNEDGTLQLQPMDGECIGRCDTRPAYRGQIVEVADCEGLKSRGAAGLAPDRAVFPGTILWLERLEPAAWPRGRTTVVTVHGRGFTGGLAIDLLLGDGETINPGVTVDALEVVSATEARLTVTVAGDGDLADELPIAYGRRL